FQPTHPRPPHLHRPRHHRQPSRLAVPIAVTRRRVHRRAPFRLPPTQKLSQLLFEEILDPSLNFDPRQLLQRSPLRSLLLLPSCSTTFASAFLSHGRCPPSCQMVRLGLAPEGLHRLFSISTPLDHTSITCTPVPGTASSTSSETVPTPSGFG